MPQGLNCRDSAVEEFNVLALASSGGKIKISHSSSVTKSLQMYGRTINFMFHTFIYLFSFSIFVFLSLVLYVMHTGNLRY